mgnify:FL=1
MIHRAHEGMCNKVHLGLLFVITIYSASATAAEYLRLTVDLDGDGSPEVVTASTAGTDDFQKYSVRAGAATFSGEFFAVDGNLPEVKPTQIGSSTKQKLLLISTLGPSACHYVILSFTQGKFFRLLDHDSKHCKEPQSRDNGQIETVTWEGFWERRDRYTLNTRGTKLNHVAQKNYPVEVTIYASEATGVAAEPLSLKTAGCKGTAIPKGSRVVVMNYDALEKRYLLKGPGDTCGWTPESITCARR